MPSVAYIYINPLLESLPDDHIWGEEIKEIYKDIGQRQQWEQLIKYSQISPPEYLWVRSLNELGDNLTEITYRLEQLESLGIKLLTLTPSFQMELKANVAKELAEIENNYKSRRLREGHARNRLKSIPPPGKAPYGYRRGRDKYIIDRSSAPVVKDFCEKFLLFGSLRGAVRYLEKRYGKKISVSTGRRWLTNPVYRGDLVYNNKDVICDTHGAIISREEAAQIDRLLRRNSSLAPRTASAPRSLAGLVVCQKCGSTMTITNVTTKGKRQEYLYLRPINCSDSPKCKVYAYREVLETLINRICEDLPKAVALLRGNELEGVKGKIVNQISQKQDIVTQLSVLVAQEVLDQETAELRKYKVNTEIAQLKAQLAQLPPVNLSAIAQAVCLPQFWLDLSESERRFYFREFIREVEIIPQENNNYDLNLVFIF